MKPLFIINKIRGIIDRISSRNIPETSLMECENWEIDDIVGDLVLGKGWVKRFSDNLGGSADALKEYIVTRDSDAKILIATYSSDVAYWKDGGSVNFLAYSTGVSPFDFASALGEVRFFERNGIISAGVGSGITNVPFWFGYIKRERFYNGSTWEEDLDEYLITHEECLTLPTLGELETDAKDIIIKYIGSSGSGTFDGGFLTATYIYDGFQESPLPIDSDGRVDDDNYLSFGAANQEEFHFEVYVPNSGINKRITGINLYFKEGLYDGWLLWRSIYFDDTKIAEIQGTTQWRNAGYCNWEEDVPNSKYLFKPRQNRTGGGAYESYIYLYETQIDNLTALADNIDYPITDRVMPNYKYSKWYEGRKYIAQALYPEREWDETNHDWDRTYDADDLLSDVVYFSSPDKPNILPITNYIKFSESVSGLGASNDFLLIFGENSLGIYDDERELKNDFAKDGCVSHNSIAEHNGVVYWCGKFSVKRFDRFYPEDISSFKINQLFKGYSLANLRNSVGCMDLDNREYILTISGESVILKYNIDTKEWTIKSGTLITVAEGADQDVVAISSGASRYIITYNSGYDQDGSYYTATATTKVLDGETASIMIKSLLMGYCHFKSDDQLTIEILVDGSVVSTINLTAQSTFKPTQFAIQDSSGYGIANENYQLRITLTTTVNTTMGQVGFIKLFGDIHGIKGA